MELLFSNYSPLKTNHSSIFDAFARTLKRADAFEIAVGYVSEESLAELYQLVHLNGIQNLILTIGMHYIEGFTNAQYNAALYLHKFLTRSNRGEVRLVTSFCFHGKIYLAFRNGEPFAGIVGSNNLSSIIDHNNRTYETSVYIDDKQSTLQIQKFLQQLNQTSTKRIDECKMTSFKKKASVLEGQEGVEKVTLDELIHVKNSLVKKVRFDIPIKDAPKSNLNVFFGTGRKSTATGVTIPRHWYEAELIVPKNITIQRFYPESGTVFTVITDDGYKFKCKTSGDSNKNFRSEGDLKILGRWLKGRMEEKGVLNPGEPVTKEVLKRYGRDTFTLMKTTIEDVWYISFGVEDELLK